jgi:Tol biopolymer transport system component
MEDVTMRTLTAALVGTMLIAGAAATQERRPQDLELQAAIRTETVEGDLDKAIAMFSAIADKHKNDRATTATALLRLAGVYHKRGDAQAKAIYERIVREFSDQRDAATQARARLGDTGRAASTTMSHRRLWAGPKVDGGGSVSPDGRFLSYTDWDTGDLAVHDIADGSDRRITDKKGWQQSSEFAEMSVFARDGSAIAYAWYDGKENYELRIADLRTTPARVRTVLTGEWLAPHDWSPDGKWVAVAFNASKLFDSTRLGLVSVEDGTLRQIRDRGNTFEMFFSPDGKYLLFDEGLPAASDDSEVYVVPVSGGSTTSVAPNKGFDRAMGWSPDGTRVLFASDRGGTMGLWAQTMKNGSAVGAPERLKSEIGDASLGVSSSGALYTATLVEGRSVYTAEIDFRTGTVTRPAERLPDRYVGMHESPDWSRDGKYMSFVYARNWVGRTPTIAIRSLADGTVREIPLDVRNSRNPLWAPDGRSFVMSGVNRENKRGIYEIDARTGEVRTVVQSEEGEFFTHPVYSPDGGKIYFAGRKGPEMRNGLFEIDRQTRALREVHRMANLGSPFVSPDGKFLATIARTNPETDSVVWVVPVDGTAPREVIRVSAPQVFTGNASWSPDGRSLMVNTFWANSDRRETWFVPIDGGKPKVLDLPGFSWGRIRVHPDGKRIAYHAGGLKMEVWVLENFLPAPTTATRRH